VELMRPTRLGRKSGRGLLVAAIVVACSGSGGSGKPETKTDAKTDAKSAAKSATGTDAQLASGDAAAAATGDAGGTLLASAGEGERAVADDPADPAGAGGPGERDGIGIGVDAGAGIAAASSSVAADSLAAFGYRVDAAAAKAGGTVRVIVRWPDTPQVRRASPGENECGKPRLPSVVPDELWGVAEAVVVLDLERGKAPGPLAPVVIAAEHCALTPRIALARPGGSLLVANRDAAVHTAQLRLRPWKSARKLEAAAGAAALSPVLPLRLPWRGHHVRVALAEPGFAQVELKSELGGKQASPSAEDSAWIAVVPSPYAAITDRAGAVSFQQVPAGKASVTVWIPARGGGKAVELRGEVTALAGQTAELVVTP
jgi:hypothetical protein